MRVPVLFATNDKYVPYCRVAIASMLEHAAPENEYIVYIFHKGLSQDSTEALTAFARENVRVELREVGNYLHSAMREVKWYTQETYYRLMAADILPEEDKLLYLDCDIVVLEDVARLYAVDMGDALLAARAGRAGVAQADERRPRHPPCGDVQRRRAAVQPGRMAQVRRLPPLHGGVGALSGPAALSGSGRAGHRLRRAARWRSTPSGTA